MKHQTRFTFVRKWWEVWGGDYYRNAHRPHRYITVTAVDIDRAIALAEQQTATPHEDEYVPYLLLVDERPAL